MKRRTQTLLARALLALASAVVVLDWALPSGATLFFDELILMALITAMRRIHL